MSTLDDWITEVARELGIEGLGELVDPAFVRPLVLDLTKDVAHGVARPAAPITAYLLGLAAAGSSGRGSGVGDVAARAEHLAALARARDGEDGAGGDAVGELPGRDVPGADGPEGALPDGPGGRTEAGSVADPAVGSG